MKKILLVMISIMLITGCESKESSIYDQYRVVSENTDKVYTETIELTYEEYNQKIQNKDSFILLMWQDGCSHCQKFEPILNEVITEYNLEIYSMNISKITDEEYAKLQNKTFITGTPTTVTFKEGVTQSKKLVGSKEPQEVIDYLVRYNYLEEIQ